MPRKSASEPATLALLPDGAPSGDRETGAAANAPSGGGVADAASAAQPPASAQTAHANGEREGERRAPLLLLMDGHAMVYRAWFALQQARPLTVRATGEDVRGVYSFTTTFFKTLADHNPTHIAIAFDPPGPTFRHEEFADYKATRPPTPPDLVRNVERVKQVMRAFRAPVIETPGYEADDVLGTIAAWASERGVDTLIATGDTDTLQLVSPRVRVLLTTGFGETKVYDEQAVRERYGGLEPGQQRDVKALTGDTSDNIPGVPGVGLKTAVKLITEFGSVEELVRRVDEVAPPRIQNLVREHADQVAASKRLVTIAADAPAALDLDEARFGQFSRDDVLEIFRELEFSSLVARIPTPPGESDAASGDASGGAPPAASSAASVVVVDSLPALEAMAERLRAAEAFAVEAHGSRRKAMEDDLVGIAFAAEGETWCVPLGHAEGAQLARDDALRVLLPLLREKPLSGHNLNYTLTLLANYGLAPMETRTACDAMIAAHLAGQKALALKPLAFNRLNLEVPALADLTGTGRKQIAFGEAPIADAAAYAGACADAALRLAAALREDMERDGLADYHDARAMPLVPVLAAMQTHGVAVDVEALAALDEEIAAEVAVEERAAYDAVGHEFNINSPPQLGDLLFKELKLPSGRRTQTGYSTDASILENLRDHHPVIGHVLRYRELAKLKSTYVETLPQQVNPRTGRIHTTYNQAGSATGRLASSDPNLQNIPIRTPLGLRVREAFVAQERPAWTLLSADYSQIDLRVLAHLSQDPALLAAFERGEDIHASTASLIYGVPLADVTRDMRRLAKVMNFGVAYGLSAFGIAQQTEMTREEGAAFIESYFGTYPTVKAYLDDVVERAKADGYAETLLGRRRAIPELRSPHYPVRQAGERIALNTPVQGTSADVINEAMIAVQRRLDADGFRSRMLLQVHDELLFEAPADEESALTAMLRDLMPNAVALSVPLRIDVKTGPNWAAMTYGE